MCGHDVVDALHFNGIFQIIIRKTVVLRLLYMSSLQWPVQTGRVAILYEPAIDVGLSRFLWLHVSKDDLTIHLGYVKSVVRDALVDPVDLLVVDIRWKNLDDAFPFL